ncbi:hypothetical protein AcV5_001148 [Taiwanofungus camphoratus]|nr:hypothetical protein AcW2_006230 [Antrodia cinnamomea]KAI0939896.1 hypothetical protein AcV5_001148 [Antrodia cinnamomea]
MHSFELDIFVDTGTNTDGNGTYNELEDVDVVSSLGSCICVPDRVSINLSGSPMKSENCPRLHSERRRTARQPFAPDRAPVAEAVHHETSLSRRVTFIKTGFFVGWTVLLIYQ